LFAFFAMDREPILFSHFQNIVIQVSESLSFWDIITLWQHELNWTVCLLWSKKSLDFSKLILSSWHKYKYFHSRGYPLPGESSNCRSGKSKSRSTAVAKANRKKQTSRQWNKQTLRARHWRTNKNSNEMIMMKCFTVFSHSDTTIPTQPKPFHHLTIYSIHGFPATRAERLLFRGAKPRNKCLKAFSYYMEMLSYTHTRPLCLIFASFRFRILRVRIA